MGEFLTPKTSFPNFLDFGTYKGRTDSWICNPNIIKKAGHLNWWDPRIGSDTSRVGLRAAMPPVGTLYFYCAHVGCIMLPKLYSASKLRKACFSQARALHVRASAMRMAASRNPCTSYPHFCALPQLNFIHPHPWKYPSRGGGRKKWGGKNVPPQNIHPHGPHPWKMSFGQKWGGGVYDFSLNFRLKETRARKPWFSRTQTLDIKHHNAFWIGVSSQMFRRCVTKAWSFQMVAKTFKRCGRDAWGVLTELQGRAGGSQGNAQ